MYLCNKNGAELVGPDGTSRGHVGVAKLCLKDMVRDEKPSDSGTCEIRGMIELTGIVGLPPKEDKKKPTKKPKNDNSSRRDMSADLESPGAGEEEQMEEEKPASLGEIKVRIAVRPPTKRLGTAPPVSPDGDGAGAGGTADEDMPTDMLELARIAVNRKAVFAKSKMPEADGAKPAVDEGAGVGVVAGAPAPTDEGVPPMVAGVPVETPAPPQGADGAAAEEEANDEALESGPGAGKGADVNTVSRLLMMGSKKDTVVFTFAYWVKWRPFDPIGDQMLFFGDPRNQPTLIRGSKLGALVDNQFCATEYDPRLAGDNWQLLVVTNDGQYSKFYIGFSSVDDSGAPTPARSQEPEPNRNPADVRTEFSADVRIRRLDTTGKGAGWLAQAWIWPRDLTPDEVRELWMETKKRYPVAKRGIPTGGIGKLSGYREAPSIGKKGGLDAVRASSASKKDDKLPPLATEAKKKKEGELMPWDIYDPIVDKDTAAMLEIPLAAKLAFQRLINVFSVLVDYTSYSASFLVIDRMHNMSCTTELMIEIALRRNQGTPPVVLLMDSRKRITQATIKLKKLIACGFLIDETKAYGENKKLLSEDFAMGADLRRLVSKAGLAWLRASQAELKSVEDMMAPLSKQVQSAYMEHGDEMELEKDGRPKLSLIWKNFYQAQLFASATHYIVFDEVEQKGKSLLPSLGSIGSIFMNGETDTYHKVIACIQDGSPLLLFESTGGVTQVFAYAMKAVRLLKPKWDVDFIMRLVTEYKARAARGKDTALGRVQQEVNRKYMLENIHLLDKELARIDLMLSTDSNEEWMTNFGLPEILMLFEIWQRAPDFLLRQLQTADVMKKNAEQLLDLFTGCFSTNAGGIPELGLGNAEIRVVATAWNRHLLLYNNARIYAYRSWIMQFTLYFLSFMTTTLSILTTPEGDLRESFALQQVMTIVPIVTALLGTVSTRLRTQQKFSACKMASYEIVAEIYKFRVKAIEYDSQALSALLAARNNPNKDKKKDDNEIVVPISSKERDKFARTLFVQRVSEIYTNCMNTEMAKGTSITHTSNFGMDPARLLRGDDTGPDESEKETRAQLMEHVANRLYFLTTAEWSLGVDAIKAQSEAANMRKNQWRLKQIEGISKKFVALFATIAFKVLELSILISAMFFSRLKGAVKGAADPANFSAKPPPPPGGGDEEEGEQSGRVLDVNPTQQRLNELKARFAKYFPVSVAEMASFDMDGGDEAKRGLERLDDTYAEVDEDAEPVKGPAAGAPSASIRIRDDFFSVITIDDYMKYRAKPVLTYFERTAPWRGYWMQVLEILIFILNASGAGLVGMGKLYVPYVALTVAAASMARSFLEFSNLGKQVEAYNMAVNQCHNLMNEWDAMTRTQRRTSKTIKMVVGTIEGAFAIVAAALTDALPGGNKDDGDGEDDEEEKDK